MSRERHAAQDISYANSAEIMLGQTVVKPLENAREGIKTRWRAAVISGRSL